MTMKKTSSTIDIDPLESDFNVIEKWWNDYQSEFEGWAYLTQASPVLLTTAYAEWVKDGDIPASIQNINAANRHLKDLERQNDPDFPWIFDEDRAYRPIKFIESKVKPSKGDFSKIVMQPFQQFIIGSVFGWVHKVTGVRRFREAVVFMGRKNGKTTLMSGLSAYMTGFDHEQGAEVYALANSNSQARLLYDETYQMIKTSPYLKPKFNQRRADIEFVKTHSTFKALSAEKKAKDGLNVHFAVFDEIHEYKDTSLIDVIKRSRGQRSQPLVMYISTAGYVIDGPMMDMYDRGTEALADYDENLDERTFYFLAKLDDQSEIKDVRSWIKANPNLPMMKGVSLITDFKSDRRDPKQYMDWVTKQFNLFSESDSASYVSIDTIRSNDSYVDPESLIGREAIGGYDLSETEDFTAAALEFPLDDGRVFILQHTFIPRARYERETDTRRIDEWVSLGEAEISEGSYINYEVVLNWFIEMGKKYSISVINYDKAKALFLNKALEENGFQTEIVRQGYMTLGGPAQNFKELMLDKKVVFNNSKIFRWYLSNVVLRKDSNENWLPKQASINRKIDGFAATLNAHVSVIDKLIIKQGNGDIKYHSLADAFKQRRSRF